MQTNILKMQLDFLTFLVVGSEWPLIVVAGVRLHTLSINYAGPAAQPFPALNQIHSHTDYVETLMCVLTA